MTDAMGQKLLWGGLEPQSNDVTWVPAVEAEVLRSYSWKGGGEADQRMTTVVLEGG